MTSNQIRGILIGGMLLLLGSAGLAHSETQTLSVDGVENTSIVDYKEILNKGAQLTLEPGHYLINITEGKFSYGPTFPAEPFVMVFLDGEITKHANGVTPPASWATLQSYDDVLNVSVTKTTKLYATYLDRNQKNNSGGVKLSVTRQ
ncbi:hypothetical protein [Hahella ganghwensis]|uniref:hypothetical protein n=1 Tax=Hahella ganghwensis TaxID=286420 RepID=UPI0003818B8F|nr:hypothetical protein [Hahella ganghwensis]